jgi:cystathionine gamma-synthase
MKTPSPSTLALHGAQPRGEVGEPLSPSIVASTSFYSHPDAAGFSANERDDSAPYFYTRWGNPTVDLLEKRLAVLERAEAAVCFASGMAATSALFLSELKAGDHLVLANVCYAGVAELAHDTLTRFGITVTTADSTQPDRIAAAITPQTRLVHIETPGNPIFCVADVEAIARVAHERGARLSVDSTIATPLGVRPLELGADFVIHSLTKYACGHGDALGGAVLGKAADMNTLRKGALIHLGASMHPMAAWLILRGLETLPARMALHQANAARVAEFLESHPRVGRAYWPGLASHPQHELARRQMKNFSGMIAFTAEGGVDLARRFAERLRVISYAVSLGKTKSLLFYIPTEDLLRTSFRMSDEDAAHYREWAGEGVFRLSVGLEDADDLIEDLRQVLAD